MRQLRVRDVIGAGCLTACFFLFSALGTWQVQRLFWKLDLIAQVDAQLARAPVAAPGPALWPSIQPQDEYLPVRVRGHYLHEQETFVQAMTVYGSGYWLMTPLRTQDAFVVLVNRGFVDAAHRDPDTRKEAQFTGQVEVTGLLRPSEPDGRFLATNRPPEDRWYSRDVQAIGAKRNLPSATLAPYFIDADDSENPGGWPVGGLTVVKFRNAHLGYALTWYALALLTIVAGGVAWRHRNAGGERDEA